MGQMVKLPGVGCELSGYLASPDVAGKKPAVLVIQEIWGLVDHIKNIADRIASLGYVALAVDLYSRPELTSILTYQNILDTTKIVFALPPEKRRDLTAVIAGMSDLSSQDRDRIGKAASLIYGQTTREKFLLDAVAAINYVKTLSEVNPAKVVSIGYCMGGGLSLSLACRTQMAGAVVYYGETPSPTSIIENLSCPVLGIYAGEDARINAGLPGLVEATVKYGKALEFNLYPGAPHGFFNDTRDVYRDAAAKDSWGKTVAFFKKNLRR